MNILVVGGGGREHAIIKKLRENERVETIYALPGNGGIAQDAVCTGIAATDLDGIAAFARENPVDFAVIAPDDPLVLGLADRLRGLGIPCFGPSAKAAAIEGSKVFAKDLMRKYGIPTARYQVFTSSAEALAYLETCPYPAVVKADGLALGKGVLICEDIAAARAAIASMDHKRALDGDQGLNTGGMGTIAPNPYYTPAIAKRCMEEIFLPTIRAMNAEGRTFKGCLYFGLMLTADGPKVIEYNCRFGDPEAQVVLPLLKTDLLTIFQAVEEERLAEVPVEFSQECACCVMVVSGGYPAHYEKGKAISIAPSAGAIYYHSGTARRPDGALVTSGGRVIGATAVGDTLEAAIEKAYAAARGITFEGAYMRSDIGQRALRAKEG